MIRCIRKILNIPSLDIFRILYQATVVPCNRKLLDEPSLLTHLANLEIMFLIIYEI